MIEFGHKATLGDNAPDDHHWTYSGRWSVPSLESSHAGVGAEEPSNGLALGRTFGHIG